MNVFVSFAFSYRGTMAKDHKLTSHTIRRNKLRDRDLEREKSNRERFNNDFSCLWR